MVREGDAVIACHVLFAFYSQPSLYPTKCPHVFGVGGAYEEARMEAMNWLSAKMCAYFVALGLSQSISCEDNGKLASKGCDIQT